MSTTQVTRAVGIASTLFGWKVLFFGLLFFLYYTLMSFHLIWAVLSGAVLWLGGRQLWAETREHYRAISSRGKGRIR